MLLPVGELPGCCTAGGPPTLPAREVGKLKRRLRQTPLSAGHKSRIKLRDLLEEHTNGPAVDDDMVQNQQQNVVVGAEPKEARAEQRRTRHVEGYPSFLLCSQLRPFEQQRRGAIVAGRYPGCNIFDDEGRVDIRGWHDESGGSLV